MLKLDSISVKLTNNLIKERYILNNLSLDVNNYEFINIVGENGAGKSTLLKSISGEIAISEGRILLNRKDISSLPMFARAKYIAVVPQDPKTGSVANFTIAENMSIAFSRDKQRFFGSAINSNKINIFREALSLLNMGLEDRLSDYAGNLSGGQLQALNLIMASLSSAQILLLDEHTSALDPSTAEKIMLLTDKLYREFNLTILMICHNLDFVNRYGTKTLKLSSGKIVK